jgi:hypothetical protein
MDLGKTQTGRAHIRSEAPGALPGGNSSAEASREYGTTRDLMHSSSLGINVDFDQRKEAVQFNCEMLHQTIAESGEDAAQMYRHFGIIVGWSERWMELAF